MTLFLVSTIGAEQILLHLATVALGWDTLLACAAKAFVTGSWASMLATRHHLVADFTAAPARVIIRVRAAFRHFMFTAEAYLGRPHVCAGRTWSSMASKLTWVRTFSRSLPSASLTT